MDRLKRKYVPDPVYMHAYQPSYNWRNAAKGSGQTTLGREFVKFSPTTPLTADNRPQMIEFELTNPRPLVCNEMFHFLVSLQFQFLDTDNTWKKMTSGTHNGQLVLAPNWFEKLFASFELIVNDQKVVTSIENYNVAQEFHGLLYYLMHEDLKKHIAPEPFNPVYLLPSNADSPVLGATFTSDTPFAQNLLTTYAKIYDNNYTFLYTPLFQFPWFQKPTLNLETPQTDFPIHKMGKTILRIHFKPKQHVVWKSTTAITQATPNDSHKFRVIFNKFDLIAEENIVHGTMAPLYTSIKTARGSGSTGNGNAQKSYKNYDFSGMFLDSKCEVVTSNALQFQFRFLNNPMPEQACIFALPKSVLNGTFDFSSVDFSANNRYFKSHNILEVETRYDGLRLSNKTPNFEQLTDVQCTLNTLRALIVNGFFGIPVDPNRITYDHVASDFENTAFPMVLIDYTLANGTRQRRQPMGTEGHAYKTDKPLDILLKFKTTGATTGATPDCIYCVYLFYSDKGMIYDPKTNKFINPFKRYL